LNLKDILYDAEGVNLVDYWHQQCKIAENGCNNFAEENKNLKAEIERLMLCINELKREVGRHERNYDPSEEVDNLINSIIQPLSASAVVEMAEKAIENHTKFEMFKAKIKSEAYREFAERLKEDSFDIVLFGEVVTMHTINEILKELVGEDDG
jgi:predicted RNase H-like nuclease (RuvC/YqgF family)